MALVQPAPRWSPSTDQALRRATGGAVRVLTDADTSALRALVDAHPVSNAYPASLLHAGRAAGPRGRALPSVFLAVLADPDPAAADDDTPAAVDPGQIVAAAWAGSNIVPLHTDAATPEHARLLGEGLAALGRRFGSVYGPRSMVLPIAQALRAARHTPRAVREHQPLMVMGDTVRCAPDPAVVQSTPAQFDQVLAASAAMFEEELGVSPLRHGAAAYTERVRRLIQLGRVLIAPDGERPPTFKADVGTLSQHCAQIHGVWVRPDRRGRGLAAPGTAAVVGYAQRMAPTVSLYVNDFNVPALRAYERVGFEQVGTFATVLY